jgi:hypothetical protein
MPINLKNIVLHEFGFGSLTKRLKTKQIFWLMLLSIKRQKRNISTNKKWPHTVVGFLFNSFQHTSLTGLTYMYVHIVCVCVMWKVKCGAVPLWECPPRWWRCCAWVWGSASPRTPAQFTIAEYDPIGRDVNVSIRVGDPWQLGADLDPDPFFSSVMYKNLFLTKFFLITYPPAHYLQS